MAKDWNDLLLAYLHDPPDKALSIPNHVARAQNYAVTALGPAASNSDWFKGSQIADQYASIVERLPMPSAGDRGERAVGPENGRLRVVHPLSAVAEDLDVPPLTHKLTDCVRQQLQDIVAELDEGSNRFLAVWRLWPERLATHCHPCLARLPADTRTPDHTIWQHLDVVAAYDAANQSDGVALLSFALGPVQRFIEAARTVRDLWSGSMILSWLSFHAMRPILEQLGPTALIYPALRGNPLLDLWLNKRLGNRVPLPELALRKTPALPHRFLALVPYGADGNEARALAQKCEEAALQAWRQLAKAVHERISGPMRRLCEDWDKRWNEQIDNYFSSATAILPLSGSREKVEEPLAKLLSGQQKFDAAFPEAAAVRSLAQLIPQGHQPGYAQDQAGRWQYQVELVQRILAARRSIRHVPPNSSFKPHERFPQKCSLFGSYEQMGPDDLRESKDFWEMLAGPNGLKVDGVRLRHGEAFCAIALVKRFAGPALLARELQIDPCHLRFPDTATIAAAKWLKDARIDPDAVRQEYGEWNGQWLHWNRSDEGSPDDPPCPEEVFAQIAVKRKSKTLGRPPIYYAILKLDGDDLGGWLRGEKSPKVREVMHPRLVQYYEGLASDTQRASEVKRGLDARRPVSPALHAAISTALANFALHVVPQIVQEHHGTVIYSGGDDTLALLPVSTAIACAQKLRQAFVSDFYKKNGRKYLMMGGRATISGGLAIVHYKDDLRIALRDVRHAEEQAKEAGKNALTLLVRRRSGEHHSAVCPWDFLDRVDLWRQRLAEASDRWVYHLYAERETLRGLPLEAIQAEIRRQLQRAEQPTPQLLPPDEIASAFVEYHAWHPKPKDGSPDTALQSFLVLCQTASFMARGGVK